MRALAVAALCLLGCTRTTTLLDRRGGGLDGGLDGGLGAGSDAGRSEDAGAGPALTYDGGIVYCGARPCVCANGLDDDGDGLVDGLDPECTGPYDADEATFATGAPGTDRALSCRDCFFDDNAGFGDDGCRYPAECLTDVTSAPSGCASSCEPSASCVNACLPRTPNGCDCFGCCEVRAAGRVLSIQLNDACSIADVGDATKCPRCTPHPACKNDCGECEMCPGKTLDDLPAVCARTFTCDTGDACAPEKPCPELTYCQQGCCVPIVL